MIQKKLAALALVTTFGLSGCAAVDEAGTAADSVEAVDPADGGGGNGGPKMTVNQKNAVGSANQYLDTAAFSKKGLIEQLKFEGYNQKDARFAVNNIEVNWMKQAAKSAQTYLEMSSFSRDGLIEQLEFEGYTPKQAAHGATQAGLR